MAIATYSKARFFLQIIPRNPLQQALADKKFFVWQIPLI